MTPEEFRASAHELIDWIVDHRLAIEQRRVRPAVQPGDIASQLPPHAPETPESAGDVLRDLDAVIAPGVTEVQHPMHFGWFPSNASWSSMLGDIASTGLSSLGISWESSPSLTEVEQVVMSWTRQLVGLSDAWHGVIHDTASTACLVALLAARERASNHAQVRGGLYGEDAPYTVYTTAEAHSSVRKAALLAGFGAAYVRVVDVDPVSRDMVTDHLADLVAADVASGARPAAVVASLGSTGVTAFDPLPSIIEIAKPLGMWVHCDAAMAGSAMLLPEQRHLFVGVDDADSLCWNPHKWMGTILDTSIMYVKDPNHLIRVMSTNPSYLRSTDGSQAVEYRDWGIPLGRRFRSLKLWFQLRIDGVEAIQQRLRRDLDNAQWFAAHIADRPGWEVVAPVRLQTVCVRHIPAGWSLDNPADASKISAHNHRIAHQVNESGEAFLTPSLLDGVWMIRVSIGVTGTERAHVKRLAQLLDAATA